MRGLGTIINALAIVIGGVPGILFKRFLKHRCTRGTNKIK